MVAKKDMGSGKRKKSTTEEAQKKRHLTKVKGMSRQFR